MQIFANGKRRFHSFMELYVIRSKNQGVKIWSWYHLKYFIQLLDTILNSIWTGKILFNFLMCGIEKWQFKEVLPPPNQSLDCSYKPTACWEKTGAAKGVPNREETVCEKIHAIWGRTRETRGSKKIPRISSTILEEDKENLMGHQFTDDELKKIKVAELLALLTKVTGKVFNKNTRKQQVIQEYKGTYH